MPHSVLLVPHSVCWAAAPHLIWTMVVTNAVTFLSYTVICITLLAMVRKTRRTILRDWGYFAIGFALFIVACGSTHLLEVITTWSPIFWVDAWTNIVTAVLSAWVAVTFALRSRAIADGMNDYADRLASTEHEKRRVEESLLDAQRLEEWSRMSTVLAHEINNPLEAIQNLLYLIQSAPGIPAEAVQHAAAARDEAARVIEITRSTLSFFRQSNQPEHVDLAATAQSIRFLLAPLLQREKLSVEVHSTGDTAVSAFAGEVRQVLLNLVRNACEASSSGSRVEVHLRGLPRAVEISVSDHGTGIPPHIIPTLFQFGTSTKGDQGNGMGLWTARQIITRHGGSIGVESTPGQGTSFTVLWPRTIATHEELLADPPVLRAANA